MPNDQMTDVPMNMRWQRVPSDEEKRTRVREQTFCDRCGKALTVRVLLADQVVSVAVLRNSRSRCCGARVMLLLDHCDPERAFDTTTLTDCEAQSKLRATNERLEATIRHLNGAVANAELHVAKAEAAVRTERKKRLAERKAARGPRSIRKALRSDA